MPLPHTHTHTPARGNGALEMLLGNSVEEQTSLGSLSTCCGVGNLRRFEARAMYILGKSSKSELYSLLSFYFFSFETCKLPRQDLEEP